MASCQQCNNLLPRTVDRCPVCGVAPPNEIPEAEFTAPQSPGWAPARPSLSDRLNQTPDSPSVAAPAPNPAPAPTPGPEPAASSPPPEFDFSEPLSQPAPAPAIPEADPMAIADYQPPAAQASAIENPNYKRLDAPPPADGPVIPIPNPEISAEIVGSLPSEAMPSHDQAIRDRTVKAQSARIEGVSVGKSENHNLLSGGMLGIGLLSLALGTVLSLPLLDDGSDPAVAAPTFEGLEEEGEAQFAENSQASIVEVRAQGCDRTDISYAFMPDARTVVIPYGNVLNDGIPTIRNQDGDLVLADMIYADVDSDLAILLARTDINGAGLGWSGASQATPGATLLLVGTSRSGEPATTSVEVVDRERNNDGLIASITVSETGMQPGAVALDAQGRLVGVVDQTGDALMSAEVLRQLVGEAKSRPGSYTANCPEPESELIVELDN